MDRFVWFVILVVVSHLVTEFTRVTGYTAAPSRTGGSSNAIGSVASARQDVVMVSDYSTQPIRVQNQVLYPGQEYGHQGQQNPQYYNDNNHYNNYGSNGNTNNNNNNSPLTNLFSNFFANNQNNNNNGQQSPPSVSQPQTPTPQYGQQTSFNLATAMENVRTFNFRPFIDSIFEIPISTLKAVNNLVGRITGGYSLPQQQQTQYPFDFQIPRLPTQQQEQQPSLPSQHQQQPYGVGPSTFYGYQKSANPVEVSTNRPKSEFELLNKIRQQTSKPPAGAAAAALASTTQRTPLQTWFG